MKLKLVDIVILGLIKIEFTFLAATPPKLFVSDSPLGIYEKAAVAADNGACSKVGSGILQEGGNAVEAIIATAICTGSMAPQSSGLGGGHFLTVYYRKSRTCTVIDARERAPENINEEAYNKSNDVSKTVHFIGWLSIGVPGEIQGFWAAYQKFGGNVPWERLWIPTIKMCREGLAVSPALAKNLAENAAYINNSNFKEFRNNTTGEWAKKGDKIKLPLLADTMEKLSKSKDPVKLFYDSKLTDLMVKEIQENGGIITREDMRNYSVKFGSKQRPVIYANFSRDLTFCAPPPPSSGSLVTSILGILNAFNTSSVDKTDLKAVSLLYHRFIEASKFAYGIRSQLGDMDFVPEALNLARNVNSPSYIQRIKKILPEKSCPNPSFYGPAEAFAPDHGTSHMVAMDQYGNAASLTSTINLYFGSKVRSRVTGILYNDQMDDFSLGSVPNFFNVRPSEANRPKPGKRPQSSMSPIIGFDPNTGQSRLAIGGAGGVKIISATAQTLMRIFYLNDTIKEAIDSPRLYNQLVPYPTTNEAAFSKEITKILQETCGQSMGNPESSFGSVVCGINRLKNGFLEANSDYRKGGGFTDGF